MAKNKCVWCGKVEEDNSGLAATDTCEECEEYFEEHIPDISKALNGILQENESLEAKSDDDKKKLAIRSYSLITAIHMLGSHPKLEFKDSNFFKFLDK